MNSLMIGCVADFVFVGLYLFRHKILFSDMFHKWQIDILYYYGTRRLRHCPKFQNPCHGLNHFWLGPLATILHAGYLKLTSNSQQLFSTVGCLEYISTIRVLCN